ncbi:MAG: maleylpyruvate isomerase, partial [Actinomycetota bacterium]|nr:maleylpyruvate isomerase [Actinomycetota bacterium]
MEDSLSLPKDPVALASHLTGATDRLLRTVETMDRDSLSSPSLLPGWTRGHVLSHIARNADAYTGMLLGAGVGIEIPPYPSRAHRTAGIEAGAGACPEEHLGDLRASAARFDTAVAALPATAWDFPVRWPNGTSCPASRLVWHRLIEVELHHVDLDTGYTAERWPDSFLRHLIREVVSDLSTRDGVVPL